MYTYAFLQNRPTLDLPPGITGALALLGGNLRTSLNQETVMAVVEPGLSLESIETNDSQLLQAVVDHDRVIRILFQQTPVLPLRFGTCFQDESALRNHVYQHHAFYLQQLQQLQGKAEYTLRFQVQDQASSSPVSGQVDQASEGSNQESGTKTNSSSASTSAPDPNSTSALKGRQYFLAKKQDYLRQTDRKAQQQLQLQTLLANLRRAYPDAVTSTVEGEPDRLHLLVSEVRLPHLHKQLHQWQQEAPDWWIQLSEPLPPYHFVRGLESDRPG